MGVFDYIANVLGSIFSFISNTLNSLILAFDIIINAIVSPFIIVGFVPSFIGSCIIIIVAVAVTKLILGWSGE